VSLAARDDRSCRSCFLVLTLREGMTASGPMRSSSCMLVESIHELGVERDAWATGVLTPRPSVRFRSRRRVDPADIAVLTPIHDVDLSAIRIAEEQELAIGQVHLHHR